MKIVANGTSIKVYVDGVLQINATDGTYTKGYFGLNVFGVAARYDNLTVNGNPFKNEVYYVRDVDGEVLAEYDGGGNLLAEYVSGNGQRIAKINPTGTVDFYLNDHLGSARAMVGSGWSANYYPFGEVASQTGSDEDTRYDFTGKERDRGTSLMYFGARYYDPEIGRWLSVDPLASKYPSLSPYNYAANNPLFFIDPFGTELRITGDSASVASDLRFISGLSQEDFNKRYSVTKNGIVTLDISGLDLSKNEGLKLLNQLITSDKMFMLEFKVVTSEETRGFGVINLSETPRNPWSTSGDLPPGSGGYVVIGTNVEWYEQETGLIIARPNITFHELAESYGRTELGMIYGVGPEPAKIFGIQPYHGAHFDAINRNIRWANQARTLYPFEIGQPKTVIFK